MPNSTAAAGWSSADSRLMKPGLLDREPMEVLIMPMPTNSPSTGAISFRPSRAAAVRVWIGARKLVVSTPQSIPMTKAGMMGRWKIMIKAIGRIGVSSAINGTLAVSEAGMGADQLKDLRSRQPCMEKYSRVVMPIKMP